MTTRDIAVPTVTFVLLNELARELVWAIVPTTRHVSPVTMIVYVSVHMARYDAFWTSIVSARNRSLRTVISVNSNVALSDVIAAPTLDVVH